MEQYIKDLINFLNNFETGAKAVAIIISLLCFIADILLRGQGIHVPNLVRTIYFCIGFFGVIWFANDFFKSLRLTHERRMKEKDFMENLKQLSGKENQIVYEMASCGCCNLKLRNQERIDAAHRLREMYNCFKISEDVIFVDTNTLGLIEKAFGFKK